MIDILVVVITVTIVIISCRLLLHMKMFTSICIGLIWGWILAGLFIQHRTLYDDFDSVRLAERRKLYHIFSTLSVLMMLIYVIVHAYREIKQSKIK